MLALSRAVADFMAEWVFMGAALADFTEEADFMGDLMPGQDGGEMAGTAIGAGAAGGPAGART